MKWPESIIQRIQDRTIEDAEALGIPPDELQGVLDNLIEVLDETTSEERFELVKELGLAS